MEDEVKDIVENTNNDDQFTTEQLENVYKNYFREDLAILNVDKLSNIESCRARIWE